MYNKSRKNLPEIIAAAAPEYIHYNAAAYVRLSADDRKKHGDSLETQRHIIERFVAENSDIHITEIYSDNNKTGTSFDRPGFQKMLADIDNGRINCVIVKDLTRFGRNAIDAGYYLDKYLPSRNVRFIAITDNHDSNDGDGGIILPLKNVLAESYALDISRKCRAVQRQNIVGGRFIGRFAPYGYAKAPQDCHKLVVDPETAPIVLQIFEWAVSGMGYGEITRRLNDLETLMPSQTPEQGRHILVSLRIAVAVQGKRLYARFRKGNRCAGCNPDRVQNAQPRGLRRGVAA